MNHERFIQKLKEYAELVVYKLTSAERYYGIQEVDRGPDPSLLIGRNGENCTLPVVIKRLKRQERPCADCGLMVIDRKINIQIYNQGPVRHYRGNCSVCKRTRDPYTGEYTVSMQDAPKIYEQYYHKKYPELPSKNTDPNK